ncbi:MAG: ComEC family competence protein [Elusimicrobium sp.]|nr:ComEC family competence protein [Elusimicrobium sp.]
MYKRPLFIFLVFYILFLISLPKEIPSDDIYYKTPADVTLTGRVTQYPQIKKSYVAVFAKVISVDGNPARGKVYIKLPPDTDVNFMDIVEAKGRLDKPFSVSVLGNFDWAQYLSNKGIYTQLNAESATVAPAPAVFRIINKIRKDILDLFAKNFDEEGAPVLSGIVLGEKSAVPDDLNRAFRDSGAMHLLVASGGNVGFVTVIIYFLCMLLGVKYNFRLPAALAAAGIYTLIAGADAPLLRAYIMTVCAGIGLKTGRNSGALHGLVLAALIIILFNPGSIREVSFQMSFLASFIILLSVRTFKVNPKLPLIIKTPAEIFLITLAVQLALLPIYTNIFYRVSFTSLVSNIFLVPLSGVLISAGFLLYAVNLTGVGFLFKAVWAVCYALLWLFNWLVKFFGNMPFAAVDVPALTAPVCAVFFICLFFIYNSNIFKRRRFVVCVLVCVAAAAVIINPFKPKNYVYLLNSFGKGAIIFNMDGKTIVTVKNFDEDVLRRALFSLSKRKADIVFAPREFSFASKTVKPFKDIWPGEKINLGNIEVEGFWGVNKGYIKFWENAGYSGTDKDGMSFNFTGSRAIFTGGENNFIKFDGEVLPAEKNGTAEKRF